MRNLSVLAFVLLGFLAGRAAAADLAKIDRTIAKEPAYKSKTQEYCLLVFGPEAATRVWLVRDGDVLYVGRKGSNDLSEAEKQVTAQRVQVPAGDFRTWSIGDLSEGDGKAKHTGLTLSVNHNQNGERTTSLSIMTEGKRRQRVYNPKFAGRCEDAPIIHFNGPITLRPSTFSEVTREKPEIGLGGSPVRGKNAYLESQIGTNGLGENTFASYKARDLFVRPNDQLVVEFAFPNSTAEGKPLVARAVLKPDG